MIHLTDKPDHSLKHTHDEALTLIRINTKLVHSGLPTSSERHLIEVTIAIK